MQADGTHCSRSSRPQSRNLRVIENQSVSVSRNLQWVRLTRSCRRWQGTHQRRGLPCLRDRGKCVSSRVPNSCARGMPPSERLGEYLRRGSSLAPALLAVDDLGCPIYWREVRFLSPNPLVVGGRISAGLYRSAQVRLGGGTSGSNPLCSSTQSVSAVNAEAVRETPRTLAAFCGRLET